MLDAPQTRYAPGPEGMVAYQVFGEGDLDLLFVSQWLWNIEAMWEQPLIERYFRQLASFARVIVFDKRGTGVSDPVPVGALAEPGSWTLPTLEQWTEDVRVVLDAAGSDRAALFGNAEGVQMALLFAATHPNRTSALVVMNGAGCYLRHDDYPMGLPPAMIDVAAARIFTEQGQLLPWAPAVTESEKALERWQAHFGRLSAAPSVGAQIFKHGSRWDVRSALSSIQVPTLILHSERNTYLPMAHGKYLAEHIDGSTLVCLERGDEPFYVGDQSSSLAEIRAFLTGAREVVDYDRVLATVLFTDLIESTERAAELGDRRWSELLDDHESMSSAQVALHRGRLIKSTGDGILATFDGPARAIRCARAIQDASQRMGLPLRAGLHTGEVELRGDDIGGIAVALAARVMSLADGAEVLVSGTVKDLVIGSGIAFDDRGVHALKGIPGEWHVFSAE